MIELNMLATPPPSLSIGSEAKTKSVKQQPIVKQEVVPQDSIVNTNVKKELSAPEMKQLTQDLNAVSQSLQTDVKFGYNDTLNEFFITVTDRNTGEEIQKLPTEQAMKIKETMKEMVGSLFDVKG